MGENNIQLEVKSAHPHEGGENPSSSTANAPVENKTTALVKQETLPPATIAPLLPAVRDLSMTPNVRPSGKTRAEMWNDSASIDLLEELRRRTDLERQLREVEHHSREQLAVHFALYSKRSRYLWAGLMCFSVSLFCMAIFLGWEFLDSQMTYRDLSKQLAELPQTSLLSHIPQESSLQGVWEQLPTDVKSALIKQRQIAIWQHALLSTSMAILAGICPALLLFKLKDWWEGYSQSKGMAVAVIAAVCCVGALYMPYVVWVDYRNTMTAAGPAFVGLVVHILHVRHGLLEKGAFASADSDSDRPANQENLPQGVAFDARTTRLLKELNSSQLK